MMNMKPITFDGCIIVALAMGPAAIGWICGDEAAKFIPAWVIFYSKGILAVLGVGLGALKAYRNTQYGFYKQNGGADPSNTTPIASAPNAPVVSTQTTTAVTTTTETKPTNENKTTIAPHP